VDLLAEERVERDCGAGVTNSRTGVVSLLETCLSVRRDDDGFLLLTETMRGEVAGWLCVGEALRTILSCGALLGVS